jgi:hypothetical protein
MFVEWIISMDNTKSIPLDTSWNLFLYNIIVDDIFFLNTGQSMPILKFFKNISLILLKPREYINQTQQSW